MRHGGSYVVDKPGGKARLVAWTRNAAEAADDKLAAATVAEREKAHDEAVAAEKKAGEERARAAKKKAAPAVAEEAVTLRQAQDEGAPKPASKPSESGSKTK